MSMLSQVFSVIIDCGISAPGHGRELVHGFKSIDKMFLFQLISTVKLPGETLLHIDGYAHWNPYIRC